MTLPKGFGSEFGRSDSSYEDLAKKNAKYPKREKPVKIVKRKTPYCNDCGHLRKNHEGIFVKGRCKVCMCPRFQDRVVETRK